MVKNIERQAICVLVMVIMPASQAHSDSCGEASACRLYLSHSVVFLGQVMASDPQGDGSVRTRFLVKEAFKGITEKEALVVYPGDSMGGGNATLPSIGAEYLVFVGKDRNQNLIADTCSPAIPVALADADLRFLREQQSGDTPTTILYGTAARVMDNKGEFAGLSATTIQAKGEAGSFQTTTDDKGSFQFRNIPPGEYEVSAVLPELMTARTSSVNLRSEEGCAGTRLFAVWDGRISGRATLPNGKPISGAIVALLYEGQYLSQGSAKVTDSEGRRCA